MVCGRMLAGFSVALVVVLNACVATVEPHPAVHLVMAGSTSMQPLMQELADVYTSRYDYVTTDIKARGSMLGLQGLRDGLVDVALVSRELAVEEEEGLRATVVAYDAIAVLVNESNPVDSLTWRQLNGIFSGDVLLWSEVGGEEMEIQVVSREDGSGTREAFEEMVMGGRRVTLTAIVVPNSQAVGRFIAENGMAIGYASGAQIASGVKAVRIDGVEPSLEAITQRDYALIRPLTLVTEDAPSDEVQAFVNFVLSPAGQIVVERAYGQAR